MTKTHKVLITGGPTNEYIDDVMKITNMATGRTALELAGRFSSFADVTLIGTPLLEQNHLFNSVRHIPVETTVQMREALEAEKGCDYDMVIHSAAVGDYAAEYSFLLEDMAAEIALAVKDKGEKLTKAEILAILKNPKKKIFSDTKISSTQPNLTVKLCLTPKIIAKLRDWFPEAILVGFKLLSGVPKKELYEAATNLCKAAKLDYVIANDLAVLRTGFREGHLVGPKGYLGQDFANNTQIFEFLDSLLKK